MPDGLKLFGANIVPKTGQGWQELWQAWDSTYWLTWLKPQVDYLVGNNIGCNCIRIIGANNAVISGLFSQSYYDTRLMQLVDYCANLGVYFYGCGGGMYPQIAWGSSSVNAQVADSYATTFKQLQQRSNVIGIDLLQEIDNSNYTVANAYSMTQLIKARGVMLPMTCSTSEVYSSGSGGTVINQVAAAGFDFLDVHLYSNNNPTPTMNYLNYFRTNYPNLDILIGEFGTSQGSDLGVEQSFGAACLNLANSGDPGIRGTLVWGCTDQDNISIASGNCWGVYDVNFVARQAKAGLLRRYTGGSLAKSLALHR